jgi:threonine dehydrogenase-like Zn-dependent dehydrogenase
MKANPKADSKILIIGDGTIALIAATMAKTYKPKLIHMLGLKDGQNRIAEEAGADKFLTQPTDEKYDLIIEAAGATSRISAAVGQLVRGGTLLLLGLPGHQKAAAIVVDDVINGDLNIIGSFGSSLVAWEKSVEMFNSGELDLGFLVTHKFKLNEFAEAIEALKSAPAPRGKIALIIN